VPPELVPPFVVAPVPPAGKPPVLSPPLPEVRDDPPPSRLDDFPEHAPKRTKRMTTAARTVRKRYLDPDVSARAARRRP